MSRFFVERDAIDESSGCINITGGDVRHIVNVLRAAPGDAIVVSDGLGTDYDAVIERTGKDAVLARITATRRNLTEPGMDITLFQGIPKSDKMDFIIQKCVELGVKRIVPVVTARTAVRIGGAQGNTYSKTVRWKRIALESAKQCDRGIIPAVEEPVMFAEALELAESCDLKLMPYEEEKTRRLRTFLRALPQGISNSIAVFIGPEGGFDPGEAEEAARGGFETVSLGPRILRTETAGMVVITILMYENGDI
ncbi:MAG: 16S rRNA (uracil(1498)-N(3))-methyltransferase [Acetivibrionales bacterium]